MGWMKHEHHEDISRKPEKPNPAEEEYYAELARQRRNKAMAEKRNIPVADPVTPRFEGRRNYPANPATDAERFEKACEQARAEAKKTGFDIAVFKNSEDQYLTWEVKYISEANKIEPLFVAEAPERK